METDCIFPSQLLITASTLIYPQWNDVIRSAAEWRRERQMAENAEAGTQERLTDDGFKPKSWIAAEHSECEGGRRFLNRIGATFICVLKLDALVLDLVNIRGGKRIAKGATHNLYLQKVPWPWSHINFIWNVLLRLCYFDCVLLLRVCGLLPESSYKFLLVWHKRFLNPQRRHSTEWILSEESRL